MSKELEKHLINALGLSTGAPIESIIWLRHLVLGFLVGIMLQIPTPAQLEQSVCSGIGPPSMRCPGQKTNSAGLPALRV